MTDRRGELGLDPDGLRHRHCSACGTLVEVHTVHDERGDKHYYCMNGHPLGSEIAGGFEPPVHPDT